MVKPTYPSVQLYLVHFEKSQINVTSKSCQVTSNAVAIIVHELHFGACFTGQCSISSICFEPLHCVALNNREKEFSELAISTVISFIFRDSFVWLEMVAAVSRETRCVRIKLRAPCR